MFFLSCGTLTRPFSLVFVKTLPKEERPSRKRKKEEYNKKRRERSGEFVKGRSSIYRKILEREIICEPFVFFIKTIKYKVRKDEKKIR
jgi:hypothetical protein